MCVVEVVNSHVHIQIAVLCELFVAVGTAERPSGGVNSHMSVQTYVLGKLLAAMLTRVRLIPTVDLQMVH